MDNIQRRIPGFIAITIGILSVGAVWSFAEIHGQKQSPGPAWEALTSVERTALFVHLRDRKKDSIFIGCNRAECEKLATGFVEVFERIGWSVDFGVDAAESEIGIKIGSCSDEALELWHIVNTKTSLQPVQGCSAYSTSPKHIILVIGTKPTHAGVN
jgi:hypothetical protein